MGASMTIYNVVDNKNRAFGTFTSRERAIRMAAALKIWFADRIFHIEELNIKPINAA